MKTGNIQSPSENATSTMKEPEVDPKNIIKSREQLYRLMISQLFYDGHQTLAVQLSNVIQAEPPCPPSDRLLHLMLIGAAHEPDRSKKDTGNNLTTYTSSFENTLGPGLDLEFETETQTQAKSGLR